MPRYMVKPGYCLHLPHGTFVLPGEEVELTGRLEREVLETQGWKVSLVEPVQPPEKQSGPAEGKAVTEPPKDRAVKRARAVK
jgi:hypothetical protein